MTTIVVDWDDNDHGTQTGTWTTRPAAFRPKPIHERIGESIDPEGDCCVLNGKPYILYGMWDYAEDWSGEFLREVHPFMLIGAPNITVDDFWKLVRVVEAERSGGQMRHGSAAHTVSISELQELPVVVITAGGMGAGKTGGISDVPKAAAAIRTAQIVCDTNLQEIGNAKHIIDQALASGKQVHIMFVYRDPVESFKVVIHRAQKQEAEYGSGRTMPIPDHIKAHNGSREVIDQVQQHYRDDPRVQITVIDNTHGLDRAPLSTIANVPE